MAKSGLIPAKPQPSSVAADEWVNGTAAPTEPAAEKGSAEPTSRITFDLPKSLHRRVMVDCTMKGSQDGFCPPPDDRGALASRRP